jgi:hypothetical protein
LTCDNSDIEDLAANDSSGMGDHISIQKRSFARGHRDGAVRYFDGAHLSKKSPPARVVSSFIRGEQDRLRVQPTAALMMPCGSHDPCHDKETR